jgi:putative SOS response-associated peptidase YedK
MCGRYVITKPLSKTSDIVKTNIKVDNSDNYNAHPAQKLPVIKSYTNGKTLELYEWGLVPDWSKKLDKFSPLINARKETLMEKITFKNLIQTSRCLVVADGYYEWKREDKKKTPHYFIREDREIMFFAAIHQNNQFCIITREATPEVSSVHHREPVIINQSQILNYLNIKKDPIGILDAIKPPKLKFHEVSKDVNKPVNNDPKLINSLSTK